MATGRAKPDCNTCATGFMEASCSACAIFLDLILPCACNSTGSSSCDDGKTGNGSCVCKAIFTGAPLNDDCSSCDKYYFGEYYVQCSCTINLEIPALMGD